jgi:apolipoprotein D and lipocalin family protein
MYYLFCASKDTLLRKDGKIGVLNSQRIKTPSGELKQIIGYAYTPDPKVPGKLRVHFDVAPVDGSCKY